MNTSQASLASDLQAPGVAVLAPTVAKWAPAVAALAPAVAALAPAATARAPHLPAVQPSPSLPALRLLTAGSVDDGKSTLIGRLLLDSRAILSDQLEQLQTRGGAAPDLASLTDGLEAEREQGITIDVAYRYFATNKRKFVIADAPGHEQYTRNMVTAAAGSDAAVVLVDITKLDWQATPVQLLPQTRRHALLAQLLRVPHLVFAVNKLDALAEPAAAFAAVRQALLDFAQQAGFEPAGIVPISALQGDNVARPWPLPGYSGPTLLQLLEALPVAGETADAPASLPVQYVARGGQPAGSGAGRRTGTGTDTGTRESQGQGAVTASATGPGVQHRVLWGRLAQGRLALGDSVQVFPSGERAQVARLHRAGTQVSVALAGQSVGVVLDRPLDVSRGDWIAAPETLAGVQRFEATLAWLDTEPATPGRRYWARHGNQWVQARLLQVLHRLDIHSLQPLPSEALQVNDIGRVLIELQQPLPLAPFARNRVGGSLILVDPVSHRTSGALLVQSGAGLRPA